MKTLYGIPNCNTVKKAQDWLRSNNIAYTFHNFKKMGVTRAKLQVWFDQFGWERVLNKQGLTFKKLTAEQKAAIDSEATAASYLLENTSAIKRPVLEVNDKPLYIGFNESEYEALK